MLHKIRDSEIAAGAIEFNPAISACEQQGQWEQTLTRLHKMRATGMTADVISLKAAISACEPCEQGGQREQALTLLHKMCIGATSFCAQQ